MINQTDWSKWQDRWTEMGRGKRTMDREMMGPGQEDKFQEKAFVSWLQAFKYSEAQIQISHLIIPSYVPQTQLSSNYIHNIIGSINLRSPSPEMTNKTITDGNLARIYECRYWLCIGLRQQQENTILDFDHFISGFSRLSSAAGLVGDHKSIINVILQQIHSFGVNHNATVIIGKWPPNTTMVI